MINLCEAGRLLYISSVDVSLGNGPGVNEREFILALHKAIGDRAHFLIPQPEGAVPELPISACTFSLSHRRHSPRHYPSHVWSTMRLADQLLSHRDYELLLFRLDVLPFAPLVITRKSQVPYALKTLGQGMMHVLSEKVRWIGRPLARANQILVRQLVKNAIVADSVSEMQVRYLRETLGVEPSKIVWIDNAVNTDRFFPMSTTEARRELELEQYDPVVGYVGNYPHERGGTQLINAVPRLLPKYPNLGLVILGNGKELQNLVSLADALGVAQHCVFPGHVPFDQVPTYVNALDVCASIQQPKGFGMSELKVRQYLACGKPVIASTPGSNDFLPGENLGSLVSYDDMSSIAHELDRWLSLTADERYAFSSRAFQFARNNLSVEQSVAKRIALWNERLNS
jgi:glycosyltransferase involved in cell wall biosynthesis